jgi:hypothetical protein
LSTSIQQSKSFKTLLHFDAEINNSPEMRNALKNVEKVRGLQQKTSVTISARSYVSWDILLVMTRDGYEIICGKDNRIEILKV